MRLVAKLMTAAGVAVAAAALVGAALQRHEQDLADDTENDSAQPSEIVHPPEDIDEVGIHTGQRFGRLRRSVEAVMPLVSFLVLCLGFININHLFFASILVLMALAFACWSVRGPRRRHHWPHTVAAIAMLAVTASLIIGFVIASILQSAPASTILEATLVGIAGLSIALATGVTWIPGWPFAEPIALGLISITLGVLCWPGLSPLLQPVAYPGEDGAALLFAAGPAGQRLSLIVQTDPDNLYGRPTSESFQIANHGSDPDRWALLLLADARLIRPAVSGYRMLTIPFTIDFFPPASLVPQNSQSRLVGIVSDNLLLAYGGQLLNGSLAGGASVDITGRSAGQFFEDSAGRSAVSLPFYGQGELAEFDSKTDKAITGALGASPSVIPPSDFTVTVGSGPLYPTESLTLSQPALAAGSGDPTELNWDSHSVISVDYQTLNQYEADSATDSLFVFAILLGVAGAGVVASLQSAIRAVLSRTARSGEEAP
jgi:hypothetical protein